ncbi:MAG: hypothetical protein OYH77_02020 [Pseudomonadota bacterium]|nr:hypothetical protein [Pseudomonadota bacterium]
MLILSFLFSAASPAAELQRGTRAQVMFYNVENLFDAKHDKGKADWQYLPSDYPNKHAMCKKTSSNKRYLKSCLETDWNDDKLALKIDQIAKVIAAAGNPDIIGLAEIENRNVLAQLAKKVGYRGMVIASGNDKRGIDVALLYRDSSWLKYVRHSEHMIGSAQDKRLRTSHLRPMLEVEFKVNGQSLYVYVAHWASPASPSEYRLASSRTLISLIKERLLKDRNAAVMAIGDFNVLDRDYPHPFREDFFARTLTDLETAFRRHKDVPWEDKISMPFGTSFYPPSMNWSSLDRLFVNQHLRDGRGLEVDVPSFRIFAPPFMRDTFVYDRDGDYHRGSVIKNVPKRYNNAATTAGDAGFSDHYPILVDLYM